MKVKPEEREQFAIVEWLDLMDLDYYHPIQENVIKQPAYWSKMKRMGWNAGLSDLIVYLPPHRCLSRKGGLLFIELKKSRTRKKNGEYKALSSDNISVSESQERFIDMVNSVPGCQGMVAFGWEEARDFIVKFLV